MGDDEGGGQPLHRRASARPTSSRRLPCDAYDPPSDAHAVGEIQPGQRSSPRSGSLEGARRARRRRPDPTETVTSPTLAGQLRAVLARLRKRGGTSTSPHPATLERRGASGLWARPFRTQHRIENADVILSLDGDFWPVARVTCAGAGVRGHRRPRRPPGEPSLRGGVDAPEHGGRSPITGWRCELGGQDVPRGVRTRPSAPARRSALSPAAIGLASPPRPKTCAGGRPRRRDQGETNSPTSTGWPMRSTDRSGVGRPSSCPSGGSRPGNQAGRIQSSPATSTKASRGPVAPRRNPGYDAPADWTSASGSRGRSSRRASASMKRDLGALPLARPEAHALESWGDLRLRRAR